MLEEKEYLYWLCQIPVLGAASIRRMKELGGSFREVFYMEGTQLQQAGILKKSAAECFDLWKKELLSCIREYHNLDKKKITFVTPMDVDYPERLRYIYNYPMGLYIKGKLPKEKSPAAAIIGARNCTNYGRQVAEYMGRELSKAGIQIISGLAAGIDRAGHSGALQVEESTFGVLGCGINICYPKENYSIYEQMLERGGILSECRLDEAPKPANFPLRNRIISGLSDAILVVEAKERSGSLITAALGLEQGKDIFALPGRITDPLSTGCNQLIYQGANILISPQNVAEYLDVKHDKMLRVREKDINGLAKIEKIVYSCLDLHPKSLEQVLAECRLSIGKCMSILLDLELGGYIVQICPQYYAKKL